MNPANIITSMLSMTTTLDPRMAALLFTICCIGEFGLITVPYVLESIWLLIGYQLGAGELSPLHMIGLWLAAQFGRQAGAAALYQMAKLGAAPIVKLFQFLRLSRLIPKKFLNSRIVDKVDLLSPFSVAYGRFIGLGIPLTLTLAVKKKRKVLMLGILISSVIWDAIYLVLGIAGGTTTEIKPAYMFLASIGLVTLIYFITFLVRRIIKRFRPPKLAVEDKNVGTERT
jgi:membrane-associated protein